MTALADAHIRAQAALRRRSSNAIARAWRSLPSYNESDVPAFLAQAAIIVPAAQRASATLTAAFIARETRQLPRALDVDLILRQARNGVGPDEVYRRPFVTVWSALAEGRPWDAAVASGLHRATSAAAMDVQLAMRQALVDVGERDARVLGYARVPDPGACDFCRQIAGQRYTTADLMPVHNHCGCGVDVITAENRAEFSGKPENDLGDVAPAAVEDHGELGPLLVNAEHEYAAL